MYHAYARLKAVILLLSIFLILVSCSTSNEKAVYETVIIEKPLIVPPDIALPKQNSELIVPEIAPQSATYKIYSQEKSSNNSSDDLLKVRTSGIRLVRDGAIRWLEIDAQPKDIWNKAIEFLEQTGFQIKVKEPKLGIIETNWQENSANIPTNWFSKLVKKLYSTGLLDKYRIRLERNNENTKTLLFLTHQGVQQKEIHDDGFTSDTVWEPRDSDPELEFEMLQRFLVFLGNDKKEIEEVFTATVEQKRTKLVTTDGKVNLLIVTEIFSRTWRRTGLAIDRLGFAVEDRNRSAGIYYIKVSKAFIDTEKKDESFFSNLFSKEQQEITQFIISLEDKQNEIHIRVLTRQGDENKSPLQKRILEELDKLLK